MTRNGLAAEHDRQEKTEAQHHSIFGDLATAEHGASGGTSSLAASGSSFGEPRFVREIDPERTPAKQFVIDRDGLRIATGDQR
jgi:hypothetical protein